MNVSSNESSIVENSVLQHHLDLPTTELGSSDGSVLTVNDSEEQSSLISRLNNSQVRIKETSNYYI